MEPRQPGSHAQHRLRPGAFVDQVVDGPAFDVLHQDRLAVLLHGPGDRYAGIVRVPEHPVLVVGPVAGEDFQY